MKEKIKENKYYQLGLTIFMVIGACILLTFIIFNIDKIWKFLGTIVGLFSPFIIGFVFAYLLNPIVIFFKKNVFDKFVKKDKVANNLSLLTTCVIFLTLTIILFNSIIPALLKSIQSLVVNMPTYIKDIKDYLIAKTDSSGLAEAINANYSTINESLNSMINNFLPKLEDMITIVSNGLFGAVKVVFKVFMGFVISIYYLSDKDNFVAGTKKIIYSIFGVKVANHIMDNVRHTNDIFGNFIVGKLLDGFTIGFITFIFLTILGFSDYALLIGVTVGLTNMIPYFGPYIGTIPSALLILMDEVHGGGKMCIIFIITKLLKCFKLKTNVKNIIVLIFTYVIEPKLCGSKTGLKSFWVLASILFFGDAFGIIGLLLGVPVFALIYGYVHNLVTIRLEEKNLPSETKDYIDLERINSKTHAVVKLSDK